MKTSIMVSLMAFVLIAPGTIYPQELWVGKDGTIRNVDTRALAVGQGEMFVATRNEVYRSAGSKERWEAVFALPSGENEINCLARGPQGIFIGTMRGLYRSNDGGRTWSHAFKTVIPEKSRVLSVELPRSGGTEVVLGTERGVFLSDDRGARWLDISGVLKNKRISSVVSAPGLIYASGDEGVFKRSAGSDDWERVSVRIGVAGDGLTDVAAGTFENEESDEIDLTVLAPLAVSRSRLYIGTGKSILVSDDGGGSWASIPANGLSGRVNCILPSQDPSKLYCSTTKGVFELSGNKNVWMELYRGMDKAVNVRSILFDRENDALVWAVTDRGLYRYEIGRFAQDPYVDIERGAEGLRIIFDGEPAFRQLQAAAMKFAEVEPEKIRNWRLQARLRALVPKVSFGIDNNVSNTYEIYTSATKDYFVLGPDDVTKGYDVSVSWDLADMIWSSDQTSIDVRSRLTTQLRNDILDDLRRVYYERKRLQFELITMPPKDMKMRFEKELRVRELTQAIDDLTGNYLTDHTKVRGEQSLQE